MVALASQSAAVGSNSAKEHNTQRNYPCTRLSLECQLHATWSFNLLLYPFVFIYQKIIQKEGIGF